MKLSIFTYQDLSIRSKTKR